jgi:hypothetical protein
VIGANSCLGELEHPTERSSIDLSLAAIKITELN